MMKWMGISLVSVLASVSFSVNAAASQYTSKYSDLDFEKCELVQEDSEVGFVQWKCPGAFGYDIYASEGDLRLYLAYKPEGYIPAVLAEETVAPRNGKNSDVLPDGMPSAEAVVDAEAGEGDALGQTIPPFNNLGPKLEWRAPNETSAVPFATIVRYHYQAPDGDGGFENGQVLVVSRFRHGHSCHVAYIDARANADANMMAREVADKYASGGTCPDGAVPVLGRGGEAFRY